MSKETTLKINIDTKNAERGLDNTSKSVRKNNTEMTNMAKKLKEITQEMRGLDVGSKAFNDLAKEAGAMKDQMDKVNASIKVFSSDTLALDQTIGVIQGIGGAYGAVQGTMALLGVENEKLMEVMVRLQAVQSITNGINQVAVMLHKSSASGMLIRSSAQKAYNFILGNTNKSLATNVGLTSAQTAATGTATVATRALGIAMRSLPFVGIIAAIGTVIGLMGDWGDANEDVADGMDSIDEAQIRQQNFLKQAQKDFEKYIGVINAQTQTRIKNIENELQQLDVLQDKTEEQKQREIELKNQVLDLNKEILENQQKQIENDAITRGANDVSYLQLQDQIEVTKDLTKETNKFISSVILPPEIAVGYTKLSANLRDLSIALEKESSLQSKLFKDVTDGQINNLDELNERQKEILTERQNRIDIITEIEKLAADKTFSYSTSLQEKIKTLNIDSIKETAEAREKDNEQSLEEFRNLVEIKRKIQDVDDNKTLLSLKENERQRQDALKQRAELLKEIEAKEAKSNDLQIQLEQARIKLLDGLAQEEAQIRFDTTQKINKINEQAYATELNDLQNKFLKFQITEAQYIEDRNKLVDNAADYYGAQEKELTQLIIDEQNKRIEYMHFTDTLQRQQAQERAAVSQAEIEQISLQNDLARQEQLIRQRASNNQLEDINRKFFDRKRSQEELALEEINNLRMSHHQKLVDNIKAVERARLNELQTQEQLELASVEDNEQKKLEIITRYAKMRLDLETDTINQIVQLNEDNADALVPDEDKWLKTMVAVQQFGTAVNQLMVNIAAFNKQVLDNQLITVNKMFTDSKEALNQQLTDQLISQEQYDSELKQLEETRESRRIAIAREQFRRDKRNQVAQTIMSGAQASIQAWVNPGFPMAIPLSAIIAAATGVSVARINNQKFTAATGGIVPGKPSKVDSVDAMLAPGEAVINSTSTQMFAPLLSAINEMGGGKQLVPSLPQQNGMNKVFDKNSNKQPVFKTYVTTTDLQNGLKTDKRIKNRAKF